jgi:hypothetical protein
LVPFPFVKVLQRDTAELLADAGIEFITGVVKVKPASVVTVVPDGMSVEPIVGAE